jgi:hypothetical protein
MPVVNYHTVNGQMVGQSTGSTFTQYLTDALGSVTATVNGKSVTNTYRYKPYGAPLSASGVGTEPQFRWRGAKGLHYSGLPYAEYFAWRGSYSSSSASRLSVSQKVGDRRRTGSSPYSVTREFWSKLEPESGVRPRIEGCEQCSGRSVPWVRAAQNKLLMFCEKYDDRTDTSLRSCVDACAHQYLGEVTPKCIATWCNAGVKIACSNSCRVSETKVGCPTHESCKGVGPVEVTPCAYVTCVPTRPMVLCCSDETKYFEDCCCDLKQWPPRHDRNYQCADPFKIIIHELGHVCAKDCAHHDTPGREQAAENFAKCVCKCDVKNELCRGDTRG